MKKSFRTPLLPYLPLLRLATAGLLLAIPHAARATVFNISDGDVAGLISALGTAQDGDAIFLAENGHYLLTSIENTTNGPNGLPVITQDIVLQGNNATIERDPEAAEFRIFYLDGVGSNAVFSHLTIKGGEVPLHFVGGGMYAVNSHLVLDHCTFDGNVADIGGGGLYNDAGSPTISNCTFRFNFSDELGGGGIRIVNGSNPVITHSLFEENEQSSGSGGAIAIIDSHSVIIGCTFTGNYGERGGALSISESDPTVSSCSFTNNESFEDGGAIWNVSNSHSTLINCAFNQNHGEAGGAITVAAFSEPAIISSEFVDNTAGKGAAIANFNGSSPRIIHTVFSGNSGGFGNGIYNRDSSPTINDCLFENQSGFDGGAIMNEANSNPAISDSTFSNNVALNNGGAIYNLESSPTILGSVFRENTANESGGAIFNDPDSVSDIGSSAFCGNDPDHIVGDWNDLGSNQFSDMCGPEYDEWVRENFEEADWDDPTVTGFNANPAGDGISNLVKYALGFEPGQTQAQALPIPATGNVPGESGESFLILSFTHPSGLTGVSYNVQLSSDLIDWPEPAVLVSSQDNGSTITRTYRDLEPLTASDRRFMRLQVNYSEIGRPD